jgi:NAD(P)-dependent dehydrogenase (short-subunit alcohol dehydrogenase family)
LTSVLAFLDRMTWSALQIKRARMTRVASMSGKTCLVTGATGGIGMQTAARLAELGATVLIGCRDETRGRVTADEIRRRAPDARLEVFAADLSRMAEVHMLAEAVAARHDRLDVLVNNAGLIATRRRLTADGFESTFAVNHLAPFLLTNLLLPLLERGAPARVVNVASAVHKQVTSIPWDDWACGPERQGQAYPLSKLANILFTAELAGRLSGVTVNCLHPGFIRTDLGRDVRGVFGALLGVALRFRPGPATGAETSVYLAGSAEVAEVTGGYFVKCAPAEPSALARDKAAAARLWALSAELTGL